MSLYDNEALEYWAVTVIIVSADLLLFKGLESISVAGQLYLDTVSERRQRPRCGSQVYEIAPPMSDSDSVGQPLTHRWAAQCSTGEAVFIDDIPPAHGTYWHCIVVCSATISHQHAVLIGIVSSFVLLTVKVKVSTHDMAPLHERTFSQKCSGMARVVKGSHSFTCHLHIYLRIEWIIPASAFPARDGSHSLTPEGWKAEWV